MSEEIALANANLAEIARLQSELTAARADVGWWHATVANYVTSATVEDRELLRMTLAEATTYPHPGAALLAELAAARAALDAIDRHVVGACEASDASGFPEPCEECGEMREIASQALSAMKKARAE